MNVTAIRRVAVEDLDIPKPLLENLIVIAGFSTAPEDVQVSPLAFAQKGYILLY
ncbi:MAG: hypothetical protein KZQ90_05220 [Candidatus Thiodiazotropha sp. (ex Codakia rugifera)]|nr:hypothetical protein [Candidatus Thiodiazotropha sp. (ex Codakia rugifera)]